MGYQSEAAKVRDMPHVMKYIIGNIVDLGCGHDRITQDAYGVDGREFPGVFLVTDTPTNLGIGNKICVDGVPVFDTVFSSHFLEHISEPYAAIKEWSRLLKPNGHLVLYLPDGDHYNNKENLEHMQDMKYEPFMFWFRRSFCGEGKDFRGEHLPKMFELVDHGLDVGDDRYSFYVIARRV